jgi:2-dehydropantoate 2-reductase
MKLLLHGAGAVGLGLASCLLKNGQQVDLVGREETFAALQQNGLQRTGLFGDFTATPVSFGAYTSLSELPQTDYDFILICTKSFDTRTSSEQIAAIPLLKNATAPIVLCQNGWGNAEIFAEQFPKSRIKNGRVITGFRRPQKHQVDITVHADAIHLGSLFDDDVSGLEPLSAAIDAGGIPCEVTATISKDLWAKMLYNCMLNGLSTVFDVPYGLLGESPHTRELMESIAHEVYAVMIAAGYATHWASTEDYIDTFYKHQLPPTYNHEPSMLQDIRADKKTEIDALNGAVVQLGQQHGIATPTNTTLTRMIQFMENRAAK